MLGPCPPEAHEYEFALYALNVQALEGVDGCVQPGEVYRLLRDNPELVLEVTYLTGVHTPP